MRFDGIHRCVYNTGRNGIEANTLGRKFNRQGSCDGLQACLAYVCKASGTSCDRLAYQRRGDVDDVSEFLETHLRHRELRHIEESCEVRLSCPPKIFGGVLGKGLGNKDARAVYQQVDSPKILNCGTHDTFARFLETNVAVH